MTQRTRATPSTSEGVPTDRPGSAVRRRWLWKAAIVGLVASALLVACLLALADFDVPAAAIAGLSIANLALVVWLGRPVRGGEGQAVERPVAPSTHPLEAIVDVEPGDPHESEAAGRKQANIEKFVALGRLSAGVVHEINNPLGGILTCLEAMRSLEQGSARYEEYFSLAKEGLERIGTVVRQLLSFARQPSGQRSDVDTNAILRDVVALTNLNNRGDAVRVVHEAGEVPPVRGFPDLVNQLYLNLALNALQAMPDGGTLRIRTWADDGDVVTSFEDTGPGVPEENLERIFEPFFTTKDVGVGTGLGLSVALGIVEAHGGRIQGENRSEGGARFIVRLPHAGRAGRVSAGHADEA
jgi:signal transduction histidine kinase